MDQSTLQKETEEFAKWLSQQSDETVNAIAAGNFESLGPINGPAGMAAGDLFSHAFNPLLSSSAAPSAFNSAFYWSGDLGVPTHGETTQYGHSNETINDRFKFESGVRVIEDNSRRKGIQLNAPDPGALKCDYHGCNYRGTFKRIYELNRHKKKHTERNALPCFFLHCNEAFYRTDKYRVHISKHEDEDLVTCPLKQCRFGPMSWDLLKLHLRNHTIISGNQYLKIIQSLPFHTATRRCPFLSCGKVVLVDDLQDHLHTHPRADYTADRDSLKKAGYDADTLNHVCPICSGQFRELSSWRDHLVLNHLVADAAHFLNFRSGFAKGLKEMVPWEKYDGWDLANDDQNRCVHCLAYRGYTKWLGTHYAVDHHLELLRDSQDIYPYRRAILALWPRFGSHPVFDDVLPQVYRDPFRREH